MVFGVADAEPTDGVFHRHEIDDAAGAVLLGEFHSDGLVTLVVIGFFQRRPCALEILEGAAETGVGIDGVRDLLGAQELRAADAELADGKGERPLLFELLFRWNRVGQGRRIHRINRRGLGGDPREAKGRRKNPGADEGPGTCSP